MLDTIEQLSSSSIREYLLCVKGYILLRYWYLGM